MKKARLGRLMAWMLAVALALTAPTFAADGRAEEATPLRDAKAGDIVIFGSYEQDCDTSNGREPIRWRVLDTEGDSLLLLSEMVLDSHNYSNKDRAVTWETSNYREWLNGAFMANAFTEEELRQIEPATLYNPGTQGRYSGLDCSSSGGWDTQDYVFALSILDVERYLKTSEERQAYPTAYAATRGLIRDGGVAWYLRSPGYWGNSTAADVSGHGEIHDLGVSVTTLEGVRPAMWVDTDPSDGDAAVEHVMSSEVMQWEAPLSQKESAWVGAYRAYKLVDPNTGRQVDLSTLSDVMLRLELNDDKRGVLIEQVQSPVEVGHFYWSLEDDSSYGYLEYTLGKGYGVELVGSDEIIIYQPDGNVYCQRIFGAVETTPVPVAKPTAKPVEAEEAATAESEDATIVGIAGGDQHIVALKSNGTVIAIGDNSSGQCDVGDWRNIVAVTAGKSYTAGLKSDGTVVAAGDDDRGRRDVSGWTDIVAIAAGDYHTVGLKSDGTLVTTEYGGWFDMGQCDVEYWNHIVAIAAGEYSTVALDADGRVYATGGYVGFKEIDQSAPRRWEDIVAVAAGGHHVAALRSDGTVDYTGYLCDADDWTDIVAIDAGHYHIVGLKADGTVVVSTIDEKDYSDVSTWTDIVSVAATSYSTVGLKSDGTLVISGNETLRRELDAWNSENGEAPGADSGPDLPGNETETPEPVSATPEPTQEPPDYSDIVKVSPGNKHTVGLKADGRVVAIGNDQYGQCEVSGWRDIADVAAGTLHTVGLGTDGAVVAVGDNDDGQCDTTDWQDIVAVSAGARHTVGLKSDGTVVAVGDNQYGQCEVSAWTDIVDVAAGSWHTVGLKSDGTVLATGMYDEGQCNTGDWHDITAIAAGTLHTVGLKANGTVVAAGAESSGSGQCEVWDWTDIVAVTVGRGHTLGLKSDGSVVCAGSNEWGQGKVGAWEDMAFISAGDNYSIGMRSDGSFLATGENDDGQCDVTDWAGDPESFHYPVKHAPDPLHDGGEYRAGDAGDDRPASYDEGYGYDENGESFGYGYDEGYYDDIGRGYGVEEEFIIGYEDEFDIYLPGDGRAVIDYYYGDKERLVIPDYCTVNGNTYPIVAIETCAFQGNEALVEVVIPEGVESISSYAFCECVNLRVVELPSTVKEIWDGAFSGCLSLERINLPDQLEYAGEDVFERCASLALSAEDMEILAGSSYPME